MSDIWDQRIDALLDREGAFSNDKHDRGGETAWGITEAEARRAGYTGPMEALSKDFARDIYRVRYVSRPGLDQINGISPVVAGRLFDVGVNCGPPTGIRFLQRALNVLNKQGSYYPDVVLDGVLGTKTMNALRAFINRRGGDGAKVLVGMIAAQQSVRYIEIAEGDPTQEDFEYGWQLNRALANIL